MQGFFRVGAALVILVIGSWAIGEIVERRAVSALVEALESSDPAVAAPAADELAFRRRSGRLPEWAEDRLLAAVVVMTLTVEPPEPVAGEPVVVRCDIRNTIPLPIGLACRGILEIDGKPAAELATDRVLEGETRPRRHRVETAPTVLWDSPGEYKLKVTLAPSSQTIRQWREAVRSAPLAGPEITVRVLPRDARRAPPGSTAAP